MKILVATQNTTKKLEKIEKKNKYCIIDAARSRKVWFSLILFLLFISILFRFFIVFIHTANINFEIKTSFEISCPVTIAAHSNLAFGACCTMASVSNDAWLHRKYLWNHVITFARHCTLKASPPMNKHKHILETSNKGEAQTWKQAWKEEGEITIGRVFYIADSMNVNSHHPWASCMVNFMQFSPCYVLICSFIFRKDKTKETYLQNHVVHMWDQN